MGAQEKHNDLLDVTEDFMEEEYIVRGLDKVDYYLIVGIGIIPFVIASIWYIFSM